MPAVVHVAPYTDRSATVDCDECDLHERHERTAPAQDAAREHNRTEHAFPDPLPITDPEETDR